MKYHLDQVLPLLSKRSACIGHISTRDLSPSQLRPRPHIMDTSLHMSDIMLTCELNDPINQTYKYQ